MKVTFKAHTRDELIQIREGIVCEFITKNVNFIFQETITSFVNFDSKFSYTYEKKECFDIVTWDRIILEININIAKLFPDFKVINSETEITISFV
jgi:hypothetical protein